MHLSIIEHEKILDIIDILYNAQDHKRMSQHAGGLLLELLNADGFDLAVTNKQTKGLDHNVTQRKQAFTHNHSMVGNPHPCLNMTIKNKKKFAEIKIWRIDNHHRFTTKDDYIFKKIKPHLHNAIKDIYQKNQTTYKNKTNVKLNQTYLSKTYALTSREAQVTLEILKGNQDEKIANTLNIAFSTLRTHLKHIFSKLQVNSRALLLYRIYLDISLTSQAV